MAAGSVPSPVVRLEPPGKVGHAVQHDVRSSVEEPLLRAGEAARPVVGVERGTRLGAETDLVAGRADANTQHACIAALGHVGGRVSHFHRSRQGKDATLLGNAQARPRRRARLWCFVSADDDLERQTGGASGRLQHVHHRPRVAGGTADAHASGAQPCQGLDGAGDRRGMRRQVRLETSGEVLEDGLDERLVRLAPQPRADLSGDLRIVEDLAARSSTTTS